MQMMIIHTEIREFHKASEDWNMDYFYDTFFLCVPRKKVSHTGLNNMGFLAKLFL